MFYPTSVPYTIGSQLTLICFKNDFKLLAEIGFFNPSSILCFAIDEASWGGVLVPPPDFSRTTRPMDLKLGPVIHLHKRTQLAPVLIRPPVQCVFYRPELDFNHISYSNRLTGPIYFKLCQNVIFSKPLQFSTILYGSGL